MNFVFCFTYYCYKPFRITSENELFTKRFIIRILIATGMASLSLIVASIIEKKYSVEYNRLQENHDDGQVATCFADFAQIC